MVVKNLSGLVLLGATFVLLSQACGSEDDKKKSPPVRYDGSAGEGGAQANSGGSSALPDAGDPGAAVGGEPTGGTPSTTGEGGMPIVAGAAGSMSGGTGGVDPGANCDPGFGECDGDPETVCEQNLNLVTSCGDCDTACPSTNANVACEEEACVIKSCLSGFADCENGAEDACETELNDNAENCGACGRNCAALGSTCAVNKCNEILLQQNIGIGSDNSANRTWAFSPLGLLHMYPNSYSVHRFPLDGSAGQMIWASGNKTSGAHSLLVIGNDLYWSELGVSGNDFTSAVYKKGILDAADSLPTLVFAPEWKPTFLRKQGNALYWFSGDYQAGDPGAYIYTRALSATLADPGTKIMSVNQTAHNGVVAFNVTSDALYWITTAAGTGTAYELRTTPLTGGTPNVVPAVSAAFPTTAVTAYNAKPELEVDGANVYFNRNAGDAADGIYRFKAGDAAPTLVVKADNVTSLRVDASFVYYSLSNMAGIWRASLTGSAGTQLSDDAVTKIVGQDAQFIYAISSTCCVGSIHKVIK